MDDLTEIRMIAARRFSRVLKCVLGLAFIVSACIFSGCASTSASITSLSDNVANKAYAAGQMISPPKGVPQETSLFVASTRSKGGEPMDEPSYSLQTVSAPPGHKPGEIERPRFGAPDPDSHFAVVRRRSLSPDSFRAEIASHISGRVGNSRDVLVYVHGFNTTLEEARFRLAQIVVDGGFTGVPILFTWPSKGELLAYGSDKESATASRDPMVKMLMDLAQIPGIGRVQILAHSMGSWLTMESLRQASIAGHGDLDGKLGSVMLAAPDVDLAVFRQQVSKLDASHFSIFVSRDDRALSLSSRIAGDRPRLGAMDPNNPKDSEVINAMGVRVYDLSSLSSTWIGHDTYANAPDAVRQIGATLTRKRADSNGQAVIDASGPTETPAAKTPIVAEPLAPLAPKN